MEVAEGDAQEWEKSSKNDVVWREVVKREAVGCWWKG